MVHLVRAGLDVLRDLLVAEDAQKTQGFMQRLDERVKVLGLASLTLLAVADQSPITHAVILLVVYALSYLSRISLARHLTRSMAITVPAALIVTPRVILSLVGVQASGSGSVYGEGVYLLLFTLRVAAASSALILLMLSTGFNRILSCLRWLKVPSMLVWTMTMTHRYLVLLASDLYTLTLARESRLHKERGFKEAWREGGALLGSFLMRSIERSERVHLAVQSRNGGVDFKLYPLYQSVGFREVSFISTIIGSVCLGLVT